MTYELTHESSRIFTMGWMTESRLYEDHSAEDVRSFAVLGFILKRPFNVHQGFATGSRLR